MPRLALSTDRVRRIYDRLGSWYDWGERFESAGKARAFERLEVAPGQRLLNVGAGTGLDHARLRAAVAPDGMAVALDLSRVMLGLVRARTGAPACQADAHQLPFRDVSFDRLYCTYVLDLFPEPGLPDVLAEFRRVLKPGGRLVLVTLTEGVTTSSRLFIGVWKGAYAVSPVVCGGCRPVPLVPALEAAGLALVSREVVVQLGIPSQVVVAVRPSDGASPG
ncbi:MAG TPA: methyltransferase domain-containing protein, partial [Chloroflexota bacterium]|nr:methyltransferase domain-containing protein [Chloroflexota bacterium]